MLSLKRNGAPFLWNGCAVLAEYAEALAEKANLHRTYISDIERGQRNVSLENIYNIAVALEIEPYMLLQKTDERNEV